MKKRTWIIGLAIGLICVLVVLIILFAGNGKKIDKKEPGKLTQNESVEEEEADLPILSNDGEEIIIETEDETISTDASNTEEKPEDTTGDTPEQEPEQEPELGSEEEPIELPFVPYEKE